MFSLKRVDYIEIGVAIVVGPLALYYLPQYIGWYALSSVVSAIAGQIIP